MKFIELTSFTNLPIVQVLLLGIIGATLGLIAFINLGLGRQSSLDRSTDDPIWPDTPI